MNRTVNVNNSLQKQIKEANQKRREEIERKLGLTTPSTLPTEPTPVGNIRAAADPQAIRTNATPAAAAQVVTTGVVPAAGGNAAKAPAAGGNAAKAPAAGGNAAKAPAAGGNSNKFNRKAEIDKTYGMIAAGDMTRLLMGNFEKKPTDQQLFVDIYNFFRGVVVDIGLKRKQKASPGTKSPALQSVAKIQQVYGEGSNTIKLDQKIFMFPEYVNQLKEILETFSKDKHVRLQTLINNINQSAANVKKGLRNAYSTKVSWSSYFKSFALKPSLSNMTLYSGVTPDELAKLIMNTDNPKGFINSLNYSSFNNYLTEVQQEAFQKLAEDRRITPQRLKDLMTSDATRMSDDQRIKMRIRLEQIKRANNNEKNKFNELRQGMVNLQTEVGPAR